MITNWRVKTPSEIGRNLPIGGGYGSRKTLLYRSAVSVQSETSLSVAAVNEYLKEVQ